MTVYGIGAPALAGASDSSDITLTDYSLPGDGTTPTFMQYLDKQPEGIKASGHLSSASAKGDLTLSYPLDLPPAILKPSLGVSYSAAAGMNMEMPYGWSLSGIPSIRRPLARAFDLRDKAEWCEAEWLIEVPGVSGTLKPSDETGDCRFYPRTSSSGYAVADYDSGANTWTVSSGGITTTLTAHDTQSDGHDTEAGTAVWRADEMSDTVGNYVTYCYDDHGRFESLGYGGNRETGEAHLITIAPIYAANTVTRKDYRQGFLASYSEHIILITVESGWKGSCEAEDTLLRRLYAYDLVTKVTDSLDLLTEIEREDGAASYKETIAKFTYAGVSLPDTAASDNETVVPESLGESKTVRRSSSGSNGSAVSDTMVTLSDFNRDGLADVVDASAGDVATTGKWQVTSQGVNHDDRTFSWNSAESVSTIGGTLGSTTVKDYDGADEPAYNSVYTTRELIDFDGDGYLDLVESGNAQQWIVHYGGSVAGDAMDFVIEGAHYKTTEPVYFTEVTEPLPADAAEFWTYSRESWALEADHEDADTVTTDVLSGLMDVNGDGWLDLFRPSEFNVWLHAGTRGGGWETQRQVSPVLGPLRSVAYTIESTSARLNPDEGCPPGRAEPYDPPNIPGGLKPYEEMLDELTDEEKDNLLENVQDAMDDDNPYDGGGTSDGEPCVKCEPVPGPGSFLWPLELLKSLIVGTAYADDACVLPAGDTALYSVSATDETGAFYDLNGDNLPDYVDSDEPGTNWKVYFNTGYDFESAADWAAPFKYSRRVDEGMAQDGRTFVQFDGNVTRVNQELLDVDGDGLLDLARADYDNNEWYKNTGAGFESAARALPSWWPDEFMESWFLSDGSDYTQVTVGTVMDLDHDGAQDYVQVGWDYDEDGDIDKTEDKVSYGTYGRPYVITKIENGQGGKTEIALRSSATVSPSGDWDTTQHNPVLQHLVDVITSTDTLTDEMAETSFTYSDGNYDDGVFEGFAGRTVSDDIDGAWVGKTVYDYELDRDFDPFPTKIQFYTDFNLNFAPSLDRGDRDKKVRFQVENTYGDVGDKAEFRLITELKTTEYGEVSGSKTVTYAFEWDGSGNLAKFTKKGGGEAEDRVVTEMTYVSDAEGKFHRMSGKTASGTDPLTSAYGVVARESYYYDGHGDTATALGDGLLTRTETCAGWTGGGENLCQAKLAIDYTRGTRGELTSVTDTATGIRVDQTFGFGAAVLETQTNALGHKLTRSVDERGRITSIKDDNGLMIETDYDDFNRPTAVRVKGTDGVMQDYKDFIYTRSSAPYYTKEERHSEDGDRQFYTVEDGFGRTTQSWARDDDGHFLVTTTLSDLRGLATATSHPQDLGTAFSAPASFSISSTFNKTYYDALGVARELIRDSAANTGSQLVAFDAPREETRQDEEGYKTKLTYDAHRRLTKVEQGKGGTLTTTAEYRYDPMDRLVRFEDGGGTVYAYSYDGAGRLREVKTGDDAAFSTWYTYGYEGLLQTSMTDSAGAYALKEYDDAGRVTKLTLSDSLPSSPGTLVYDYDYDDKWIGAVFKTTDPSGTTDYDYDEYGRVAKATRSYTSGRTAAFSYDFSLQGELTSRTLPSGRMQSNTRRFGWLTGATVKNADGQVGYTLTYDYNDWGLWSSVVSSKGPAYARAFTTPLRVDSISLTAGSNAISRSYTWKRNDFLDTRTSVFNGTTNVYNYAYEDEKQLTKVSDSSGSTLEHYVYGTAGFLGQMDDSTETTWTYARKASGNQIRTRTSGSGTVETYTYDAAGRLSQRAASDGNTVYYYDGLGRLRGLTKGGAWQMVLDYDAEGNLTRRGDNNAFENPASGTKYAYSFHDWRYDEGTGQRTEFDSEFVARKGSTRIWQLREYDGHVAVTVNDGGSALSKRRLGGFGADLSTSGSTWAWHSFHGVEEQSGLFHMGRRHLMKGDGQWLQPEPLLYEGIPTNALIEPLKLAPYRYAGNNPTHWSDQNGKYAEATISGNQINITIPIQYMGYVTPGEIEVLNGGIELYWSGKIGEYNVTVNVIEPSPGTPREKKNIIMVEREVGGRSAISIFGNASGKIRIDYGVFKIDPFDSIADLERMAAHEAGHLMGLFDKYYEIEKFDENGQSLGVESVPLPDGCGGKSCAGNIMADGQEVLPEQIEAIIASPVMEVTR